MGQAKGDSHGVRAVGVTGFLAHIDGRISQESQPEAS